MSILAASTAGTWGGMIIWLVIIFVFFYFFMIRPQQKRQKEIKKFREGLGKGDKVVTAGGIFGTIREVKDTSFIIEIDKDVRIRVDKGSVYPSAEEANQAAQNSDQTKN